MTRLSEATPLQRELHQAHLARQQAFVAPPPPPPPPRRKVELQAVASGRQYQAEMASVSVWMRQAHAYLDGVVTMSDVVRACQAHYGIARSKLLSRRRSAEVVRPRQVAMYLAIELTESSLSDVGRGLGGMDHTTILNGISRIRSLLSTSPVLRADVEAIKQGLCA